MLGYIYPSGPGRCPWTWWAYSTPRAPPAQAHRKFIVKKVMLVQVQVVDNNVEKAIKLLKRKLTKEGIFRQLKEKRWHEKPSDARRRKQRQARRRVRRQIARAKARSRG